MLNIETKELKISDKLKRKIDIIGRFTNTTPIIHVGIDISFTFPENAFTPIYDNTPNAIPSAIEYAKGIIIIVRNAGIASV